MSEDIRKAIIKMNSRFGEEVRKGDSKGLSNLYTEDAVILPPNSAKVHGRKGAETF